MQRCKICGNEIKLGELYSNDWCLFCFDYEDEHYPSYVNISTPEPSINRYKLQDMKFVFDEELEEYNK